MLRERVTRLEMLCRFVLPGVLGVAALALNLNMARAQAPKATADDIDTYIRAQMERSHIPGAALAITHETDIVLTRGYGTAGRGQMVTPQTQFLLGSVSKSFTALAVMQLVERGQFSLDTPVRDILADFTLADARAAERITVRDLLNHTSGLSDAGYPEALLPQPTTIAGRVASLRDAHITATPGTEFQYFNLNYAVLARIVEVISGQPYGEYLETNVFAPLAMHNTSSIVHTAELPDAAPNLTDSYILAYGVPFAHAEWTGYLGGYGDVVSTAEDMAHFLIMQNNGGQYEDAELISEAGLAAMHTPPSGLDSNYAMGWMARAPANGPRVIEHNGVLSTFHSNAALLPDEGYGVILLFNDGYAVTDFEGIQDGVIALLTAEPPPDAGMDMDQLGFGLAALTLVTVGLQLRALLRLNRWATWARTRRGAGMWRVFPGLVWAFVPAVLLLLMPAMMGRFMGRVFNYEQLFLATPDILGWWVATAVLGVVIGIAHVTLLLRRRISRAPLSER